MRKTTLVLMLAILLTTALLTACKGASVSNDSGGSASDGIPAGAVSGTGIAGPSTASDTGSSWTGPSRNADAAGMTGSSISAVTGSSDIADINSEGVEIYQDKSFWVNLDSWGVVWLVSSGYEKVGQKKARFYLVNKDNKILYRFPDFSGNGCPVLDSIGTVSVKDVDGDGLKDIIIIADYITGVGENGTAPFPVCSIYFQRENEFISLPDLDIKINEKGQNENVEMILKYIGSNDIDFEKKGTGADSTSALINRINSFTKYIETHFRSLKTREIELESSQSQGGYITGYYEGDQLKYTNAAVYNEFESDEYQIYHINDTTIYITRTKTVYDKPTYNEDAKISEETKKEYVVKDSIAYELVDDILKKAENTKFLDDVDKYENRLAK